MNPKCTRCGNYLLPCTATATGIHPEVRDATSGKLVARDGNLEPRLRPAPVHCPGWRPS